MTRVAYVIAACLLLDTTVCLRAEDKPKEEKKDDKPQVLLAKPLGLAAGTTEKIVLRGDKLDGATEIKFPGSSTTAKVLNKGGAPGQDQNAPRKCGGTQVEVEITAPADLPPGELMCVVATPAGETAPFPLLLAAKDSLVKAKPGGGFRDAAPIKCDQACDGIIDHAKAVHVYRVDAAAGQKLEAEIIAWRKGSCLDSLLTAYDASGHILATNDDFDHSPDSKLTVTSAADGPIYLSVIDAYDTGSAEHVYRLLVRRP